MPTAFHDIPLVNIEILKLLKTFEMNFKSFNIHDVDKVSSVVDQRRDHSEKQRK